MKAKLTGKIVKFKKAELTKGIAHEKAEHPKVATTEAKARQLVADHLTEHPNYYTKLQTVFKT